MPAPLSTLDRRALRPRDDENPRTLLLRKLLARYANR